MYGIDRDSECQVRSGRLTFMAWGLAAASVLFAVTPRVTFPQSNEPAGNPSLLPVSVSAGAAAHIDPAQGSDSTGSRARMESAYRFLARGRYAEALSELYAADRIRPSDTTKLQIAYTLNALGKTKDALATFQVLSTSRDRSIRDRARSASVVLDQTLLADRYPWWGRVYAFPFYDSRFENSVFAGGAWAGYYLSPSRITSVYAMLSVTRDTRSTGGGLPVLYSDNYLLLGSGLRFQPLPGLTADVQGGITRDLITRTGEPPTQADFRAVASYGNGLYPSLNTPGIPRTPWAPMAEMYASFGYYSRYHNGIGYGIARAGVRVFEWDYTSLDLYVRGALGADTRGEFYNNVGELGPGAKLIPDQQWGVAILAEFVSGRYLGGPAALSPYGKTDRGFRAYLILDRLLVL